MWVVGRTIIILILRKKLLQNYKETKHILFSQHRLPDKYNKNHLKCQQMHIIVKICDYKILIFMAYLKI